MLYRRGWREQGAVLLPAGRLLDASGFEFMLRSSDIEGAQKAGMEVAGLLGADVSVGVQ